MEETRDKIRSTLIVRRLQQHIDGKLELSSSQVNAAKILLNKVLPDLKAMEMDVTSGGDKVTGINLVIQKPGDDG